MLKNCRELTCKNKALSLSEYCWENIEDKMPYRALLAEHIKSGKPMENFYLKGIIAPELNFMHVNLKGANLAHANLRGANFSDTNLSDADLIGSNLSECDFIGADCVNTCFMMAQLPKARFWHANLTNADLAEANLECADFLNAILTGTNLYHANLRDVKFLTRENFKDESGRERINEKGHKTARESYASLKQHFIATARYNDVSWASYNENRMELKRLWKEKRIGLIPFLVMGLLCGWGERPLRATVSTLMIITCYAIVFFIFKSITPTYTPGYNPSFFDYFYYSIITFTTVGYGDFLPKPDIACKLLAGSEAFIGIFMMGIFVFSLGRRYASR